MILPTTKLSKDQRDIKLLHNLVVKVILWKSKFTDESTFKNIDKISTKEWLKYKKYTLGIATPENKIKVQKTLKEASAVIKSNGGFED